MAPTDAVLGERVLRVAFFEYKTEIVVLALPAAEVEVVGELPTDDARIFIEPVAAHADRVFVLVEIETWFGGTYAGWGGGKARGTKKNCIRFHGMQPDRAP